MSNKHQIDDFITLLKDEAGEHVEVNGKNYQLGEMTWKQHKSLVTSGLDGLLGVVNFIQSVNSILIDLTGSTNLKITDRTALILHVRNKLSPKPIKTDEKEVEVGKLVENIKNYSGKQQWDIETDKFKVNLEIPTLVRENKFLVACNEELKQLQEAGLGDNISTLLSYEIPKFITSIQFGENSITFDSISIKDKIKIASNLPATVVSEISEFITTISQYDEELLTYDGVTVELDSTFFE